MLPSYLISSLRYFHKNRNNFLIILLELIVGLLCFFLVFSYIHYEYSYDKHIKNSNQIFRITTRYKFSPSNEMNTVFTAPLIAPVMYSNIPEIKYYTRIYPTNQTVESENQKNIEYNIFWADSTFFNVFRFRFIHGNPKTVLNKPKTVVITETISQKYFQNENSLGKILLIGNDNPEEYMITGVIENIKSNTHLNFEFILSGQNQEIFSSRNPGDLKVLSYVVLNNKNTVPLVESKCKEIIDSWGIPNFNSEKYSPALQAVTDIHLGEEKQHDIANTGNAKQLIFLGIIAVLILFLSCLNYVNIMALNGEDRAKEFCVRKVHGASKRNIISHFLMESNVFVFVAIVLTLMGLYFVFPEFKDFVGKELYLSLPFLLLTILILIFVIGNVSGLYPAVLLSRLDPVIVLKGIFRSSKQGFLYRRLIMIFQFTIIIIVAVCAIVVQQQMHFIQYENHGYEKENLYGVRMVINVKENSHSFNSKSIKQELLKLSEVEQISCCDALPEQGGWASTVFKCVGEEEKNLTAYTFNTDYDYLNTLGIELVEGRNFSKEFATDMDHAILINETAVKELGLDNPVGQKIIGFSSNKEYSIIGVMKDYNFRSLYYNIEPLAIGLKEDNFNFFAIKTNSKTGDISESFKDIMSDFDPDFQYSPFSIADRWKTGYKKDRMLSQGFNALLLIVFIIAGIGLYAFSNYIAKKWQKNISIRKVLGASKLSILKLYLKEYLLLIFVSMLIGISVSYYLIKLWLQNFAFQINLTALLFILPAAIILVFTLVVMMISIFKSIHANPADYLSRE